MFLILFIIPLFSMTRILCSVWKMIFPSIRLSFQKRTCVIFLDIGEILEKGVHESSVCDTGVYRFPNFHIFKQFSFQIPYNLDHFFQLHENTYRDDTSLKANFNIFYRCHVVVLFTFHKYRNRKTRPK
jgi:hypothetical protein